jgi:hypothetical protein
VLAIEFQFYRMHVDNYFKMEIENWERLETRCSEEISLAWTLYSSRIPPSQLSCFHGLYRAANTAQTNTFWPREPNLLL